MSIRVTSACEAERVVIHIAGQLRAEDVSELAGQYEDGKGPDVIDLSDLQSADDAGVQLLLELVSRGAQIRCASPYIELLMSAKR